WMTGAGSAGLTQLIAAGGALVLVVDAGGGTTDLSLVRVEKVSDAPRITRVAVGRHLLLGGDNMDLALAHAVEPRFGVERLDVASFAQLVAACRHAKETLLAEDGPQDAPVAIAARGANLVGRTRTARLGREEVERIVLDGFFPFVTADARQEQARGGLVAFGLPFERDAAITRHIASFLRRHLPEGESPDALLLNGGVVRALRIASRLIEVIESWRGRAIARLPHADPDLAVARGAVAYAQARHGLRLRIGGGSARGYFVRVASEPEEPRAVCVIPRAAEEGASYVAKGRTFALAVGRPARFDLFASDDALAGPGDLVDIDGERFEPLPPLVTRFET
ncbi:MAG: Hsp70 family protein, partial [Polyangiaceae bacterium]